MVTRPPAQGRDAAFSAAAREAYRMCEVKKMQNANVSFEMVRSLDEAHTLIEKADASLRAIGYTEHSYQHVTTVLERAASILTMLDYPERTVELVRIAGYLHDIGNVINRIDHAQSGAIMAFRILDKMGMDAEELSTVISAIGNHDESTAYPVNEVAAALILADKTDVRRTRVRNTDFASFDMHDRVNYAVVETRTYLTPDKTALVQEMTIDTQISPVMDYFEIFLDRMLLCRKAAERLGLTFRLRVNGQTLL